MSDELYFDVEQVYEEYRAQPALSRSEEMFRAGLSYQDIAEQLEAENNKLRELMSVMAYCNQFRRDCDGCSMNGAAGIITERAGCDELLARLRELGIEVGV